MNDPREWAISYLASRGDTPWRWADDGDVIVWADGTTIAFRAEVAFVLEWLVPHGWPSFGDLVLLLAASRGKVPPVHSVERRLVLPATSGPGPKTAMAHSSPATSGDRLRRMQAAMEEGLARIAALPEPLRTTPKAKAVLAEAIFGAARNPPENAALFSAVVEVLRSGLLTDAMLNDPGAPPPLTRNGWLSLDEGLRDINIESLTLRLRTGLDELPQAPELPEIASVRVRTLLEELRSDREYAGLARLARDFMAALQLPRRLSERDEMPIGGFADLANRGNLDRLLLSELAHDDLTLAVRIALNEALYLRREPPAKQPPGTLAILIDSGIRLWGVPRLLAAAVALALIAKSDRREVSTVFRAGPGALQAVDLLTREGLIAHLGVLETSAHPGAVLGAFCQIVEAQERAEAILITHRDVLADAGFQRQLAAANFEMLYLAVVDREGGFELLRYPQGGAPVCQARMNLEALWPAPAAAAQETRRKSLIDREAHPELPAAFSRDPFPLLIAVRGKVQAAVATASGGGLCVMQDRRLFQWDSASRGARTLAWSLPRGQTLWLGELSGGRICVIKTHAGGRELYCRVFLPGGELISSHDWRFTQAVRRVEVRGNFVYAISLLEASVRDLTTGEQLGSLAMSRGPSHGIYFRAGAQEWTVLAWNGLALEQAPVILPAGVPSDKILRVFDRQGFEGPWCLTRDGNIYSHEGRLVMQLGPLQSIVRVCESGQRLLVAEADSRVTRLVDLPTLTHRVIAGAMRDQDWEWSPTPPTYPVRVRFDQIGISRDGILYLRARSGGWLSLFPRGDSVIVRSSDGPENAVAFEPLRLPGGLGFSIQVAHWPDRRCAWLDDRGMLHLRCADRSHPELTIVLSDMPGAWSSDERWFGSEYFAGDHECGAWALVIERLHHFSERPPVFPGPRR